MDFQTSVLYLTDLLRRAAEADGGVTVETFAEIGFTTKPSGVRLTLSTGATTYVQFVGTYSTSVAAPEGEPLPPVDVPGLTATDGRVAVRDVEAWIAAVITNGGSRWVGAVAGYSTIPGRSAGTQPYGVRVALYDGSTVQGLFVHTLRRDERPGVERDEFAQLEVI